MLSGLTILFMPIIIDYNKCCWRDGQRDCGCPDTNDACTGCVEVCPVEAITRENIVKINLAKCIECSVCITACKYNAISLN